MWSVLRHWGIVGASEDRVLVQPLSLAGPLFPVSRPNSSTYKRPQLSGVTYRHRADVWFEFQLCCSSARHDFEQIADFLCFTFTPETKVIIVSTVWDWAERKEALKEYPDKHFTSTAMTIIVLRWQLQNNTEFLKAEWVTTLNSSSLLLTCVCVCVR